MLVVVFDALLVFVDGLFVVEDVFVDGAVVAGT